MVMEAKRVFFIHPNRVLIILHGRHRSKVIGCADVIVVDSKITKSGDLRTCETCKCNESVKFDEKLASACLESSGVAY